jgi:hypothetical protein
MRENKFQSDLRKRLSEMFPGCFILKNDPTLLQGVPDLTILFNDRWAGLEVKRSASSPFEPNQEYYISVWNEMSFAAVIYPENEEEVLRGLQQALRPRR